MNYKGYEIICESAEDDEYHVYLKDLPEIQAWSKNKNEAIHYVWHRIDELKR